VRLHAVFSDTTFQIHEETFSHVAGLFSVVGTQIIQSRTTREKDLTADDS
jgi:hypothetical protein